MHNTLVVIPCGKSKIWKKEPHKGPTIAMEVYTGAPFKVNKEYVTHFEVDWVILSAKYGLISPEFTILADYNVNFNDQSTNPVKIHELKEQAKNITNTTA